MEETGTTTNGMACKDSDILYDMLERVDYNCFTYDATPQYVLRASFDTADNTHDYNEEKVDIDRMYLAEW